MIFFFLAIGFALLGTVVMAAVCMAGQADRAEPRPGKANKRRPIAPRLVAAGVLSRVF